MEKKVGFLTPEKMERRMKKPMGERLPLYGEKSGKTSSLLSELKSLTDPGSAPESQTSKIQGSTEGIADRISDLHVSTVMSCITCDVEFDDRSTQTLHYKTDWHRFNLKQRIKSAPLVTEDAFVELAGDISSLSGTDFSDDETDEQIQNAVRKLPSTSQIYPSDSEDSDEEGEALLGSRQTKLYLRTKEGSIVSLYRNVVCGKKEVIESNAKLLKLVETMPKKKLWVILMIGGGHFAGAVFDNGEPVAHKTFHRYVVRAKSGGVQSQHDKKGGHAKSAGATIRRHNETALGEEVSDLMHSWSHYLVNCDRVFVRVATYNYSMLFGNAKQKDRVLRKQDSRIRMIPFPTRRATFSEVKRVYEELSTIECFDASTDVERLISPSSRSSSPAVKRRKAPSPQPISTDDKISPNIDLSNVNDEVVELEVVDTTIQLDDLREFDDSWNESKRKKKRTKKKPKESDKKCTAEVKTIIEHRPAFNYQSELYTASKLGDLIMLEELLTSHADSIMGGGEELGVVLSKPLDQQGNTLLHIAAQNSHPAVVKYLLDNGCSPTVSDCEGRVPFLVSANKPVKNEFRMFMADYPEKFDYEKAQIPSPLPREAEAARKEKDAERRREMNRKKKEKLKVKKIERAKSTAEEEEQKRYLALSDREKRALAAERRLLQHSTEAKVVLSRCYQCAADITGKVPFEYSNYNFCSPACLKIHRLSNR